MAISLQKERDLLRIQYTEEIKKMCAEKYDDVMTVKSDNKFCFPVVGIEGTEFYCEITVAIPKGSKDEPYDGYRLAQDYIHNFEEKERKKKEREEEKRKKKEKDEEIRRKKAEQKNKG